MYQLIKPLLQPQASVINTGGIARVVWLGRARPGDGPQAGDAPKEFNTLHQHLSPAHMLQLLEHAYWAQFCFRVERTECFQPSAQALTFGACLLGSVCSAPKWSRANWAFWAAHTQNFAHVQLSSKASSWLQRSTVHVQKFTHAQCNGWRAGVLH